MNKNEYKAALRALRKIRGETTDVRVLEAEDELEVRLERDKRETEAKWEKIRRAGESNSEYLERVNPKLARHVKKFGLDGLDNEDA